LFNKVFQIRAFHNDDLRRKNGSINSNDFYNISDFPTARDIDIHLGKGQVEFFDPTDIKSIDLLEVNVRVSDLRDRQRSAFIDRHNIAGILVKQLACCTPGAANLQNRIVFITAIRDRLAVLFYPLGDNDAAHALLS